MSNLEAVTKVADQIISSLFYQRQFTSGEISYLARELGDSLNLEGNFDKILKTNENVCVISDASTEEMCLSHDAKRKEICDQVSSLVERTERILQLESEFRQRGEKVLDEKRKETEQKKQACMMECDRKLEQLRESIMQEELGLERKYLKFEENLRKKC